MPTNDLLQTLIPPRRSHISKSKHDDAGEIRSSCGHQIAEIQVVHQQNSILSSSLIENLPILHPLLFTIKEMHGILSSVIQEGYRERTDVHVGQKSYATDSTFSSVNHAAYWRAC